VSRDGAPGSNPSGRPVFQLRRRRQATPHRATSTAQAGNSRVENACDPRNEQPELLSVEVTSESVPAVPLEVEPLTPLPPVPAALAPALGAPLALTLPALPPAPAVTITPPAPLAPPALAPPVPPVPPVPVVTGLVATPVAPQNTTCEPFVFVTFIFFTLFPLMLWVSGNFMMLIFAFVIRGFKEFGDTSRKALIIGYCAPERRGQMIGAYYLVRDLIVSAGAIIGAYLWEMGPGMNFLGAIVFGVAGTVLYFTTIRHETLQKTVQ